MKCRGILPGKCIGFLILQLFVCVCVDVTNGARILGLFTSPATSHNIMFQSLMKVLAQRGHSIEVASPCPLPPPIPDNYKDFKLPTLDTDRKGMMKKILSPDHSEWQGHLQLWSMGNALCEKYLSSEVLQKYLSYNISDPSSPEFDLIIVEIFFYDCLIGFGHHFDVPIIAMISQYALPWASNLVGNPDLYSFVPHVFLRYGKTMTFFERLHNYAFSLTMDFYRRFVSLPQQTEIARQYFGPNMPPLWEIEKRVSLVFSNGHPAITPVHPMMPNLIDVAGMHVLEKPPPLPEDLQELMSNNKKVILFSLGSVIDYDHFETERLEVLLNALKDIKSVVLWKWHGDVKKLPVAIPENVRTYKWLPQQSLLSHPNLAGFITHGGVLSLQEAIYHGVPFIGFPFFGDQFTNMNHATEAGVGIKLNFYTLTKGELVDAVHELLNNPVYSKAAKRLSSVFRDQPETPLQRGVYWTEYVLRHKGAPHLRSAAADLNWFQYYLIDVAAFVILLLLVALIISYYLCRSIILRVFGTRKKTKKD